MATNTATTTSNDEYTASRITVLEGLEAVRRRPGMYIGPTDINGLHHMIREVVDNSVDEALAGFADRVDITIHADGSVTVVDNGRGIPVDIHPVKKVSGLELAATQLHAGGKFDSNSYKVSSGLHGVGLSVVNALSTWMRIEVKKDGRLWKQEYNTGKPRGPVKPVGVAEGRGTIISFLPDVTIFKDGIDYTFKALAQRFREMAYLTKGLRFHFVDERDDSEVNFYFEGGIVSYVRHLNKDKNVLHRQPFYVEREVEGVAVEIALQYTEAYDTDSIYPFANNINNVDGGSHMTGFRTALTRVLNSYARGKNLLKENEANLTGDDVREGLTAVLSVKLQDPQFSSQTKEKLVSPEASSAVSSVFADAFAAWLDENPGEGKRIVEKCVQAARTRLAVQKVRETARKSAMDGFSLPGKLADCSDTNPARCEIYIVEGDSAGGCLAPETPVLLASGLVKTMKELAEDWKRGIQHLGYATDEAGDSHIVPLIEPRLTKRHAALVEVILDNGERIRCTPDHPFRLQDGSYRAAGELRPGVRLMSLIGDVAAALIPINASTATFDDLFTVNKGIGAGRGAPLWAPAAQSSPAMVAQAPHRLSRPTIGRIAGNHGGLPLPDDANDAINVAAVGHLDERDEVYDLTVEGYHNFALAGGIFVHNSAKQGRDRRFQAILPLRGKILNVEKSRLDKMLSNNEVRALITAIGASVGDQFDLNKLRYHRIVLMSVDGNEMTFVKRPNGQIAAVRIGPFIDQLMESNLDPAAYQVLCFDKETGETRFKPLKGVISHDHEGPMYEIETVYGRRVRVTGSHSIYVADVDGHPTLKRGDQIQPGDLIVAPAQLPLSGTAPAVIDLLRAFVELGEIVDVDLIVRGAGVEEWYKRQVRDDYAAQPWMIEPRVSIPIEVGETLKRRRQELGLSQREICTAVGIRQPVTYYGWERGDSRPTVNHFVRYVEALGLDRDNLLDQVAVGDSRLDRIWNTQYRGAPANRVRSYVPLRALKLDDLELLGDDVTLSPRHYAAQAIPRYIPVNESLMLLLGFFVAEGSLSQRNGFRLAIGKRNQAYITEFSAAIRDVFGLEPTYYTTEGRVDELRVLNSVVSAIFRLLFKFNGTESIRKHIPDLVFNVDAQLQLAFLRGYFLGDGSLLPEQHRIVFDTSSETLANQLMYLLLAHGIVAGVSQHEPTGVSTSLVNGKPVIQQHTSYRVWVSGREALAALKPVWCDHTRAVELTHWLMTAKAGPSRTKAVPLAGNLVGLPVRAVHQVEASNRKVYDFSVEKDENFICGFGGIAAKNTDADVDGSHIRTLLLTFFFRYMRPLIINGHLFIAQPPLYSVKQGKDLRYIYNDAELESYLGKLPKEQREKVYIQRYKGLGEMNAEQLWETTMNPANRIVGQVTLEDAQMADETFTMLMGDLVPPRKRFIQTHAAEVRNLDI